MLQLLREAVAIGKVIDAMRFLDNTKIDYLVLIAEEALSELDGQP
jgi:hypothetical protein